MEQIMDIIIKLAGTLAATGLLYLVKTVSSYVKGQLNDLQEAKLDAFVSSLVTAAQQMYRNEPGEFRLEYVQTMLIEAGYELTDVIRALIESKVYEINQKGVS